MSIALKKRVAFEVPDTANEQETISLGRALKSALFSGITKQGIEAVPHQETVGKFLTQYDSKAVSSAMIKRNADACQEMITLCGVEMAKLTGGTDEEEDHKLKWQKLKATYMQLYHEAAVAYPKMAGRDLAEQEHEKARTPSFPLNANVSAPVMAQQVNVVVHQHKED